MKPFNNYQKSAIMGGGGQLTYRVCTLTRLIGLKGLGGNWGVLGER